jgi:hypothetical protein
MTTTTITWQRTADGLPDDEILVICNDADGSYAAFYEGEGWHYSDGMPVDEPPLWWAQFPAGPEA